MLNNRRILCWLVIALFLTVFSGCAQPENSEKDGPEKVVIDEPVQTPDEPDSSATVNTDSGTFTGRIDDASIEIMISGVPEDKAYHAFELSNALRKNFDSLGIKSGDAVVYEYEPSTDNSRSVITKINKITNKE